MDIVKYQLASEMKNLVGSLGEIPNVANTKVEFVGEGPLYVTFRVWRNGLPRYFTLKLVENLQA